MSAATSPGVALSPREMGFMRRIAAKYPGGKYQSKDLYRSLAIFSAMFLGAHLVERWCTNFWLPLLLLYPPAIWLFSRYRRFSIFRSCILSKAATLL